MPQLPHKMPFASKVNSKIIVSLYNPKALTLSGNSLGLFLL
jgi:hypothetical protein